MALPSTDLSDRPTISAPQPSWQTSLSHALTAATILFVALASFRPLRSSTPWMLFMEDDFFYYLKVAANLAHGHGSTFNGIVATNGYHPLWFLLLAALSAITSSPGAILAFVALTLFLSTTAIYFLTRRLLTLSGVNLLLASSLSVYATAYAMHILFGGMEVVLTVPLILLVVLLARSPTLFNSRWPTFTLLGLATSAMVLSRLDTLLLAILIFLSVLLHRDLRARLTAPQLAGLALGLLPVFLYFASNLVIFHTLLPISGAAKQLKTNFLPSAPAWRSAYVRPVSQLINLVPILLAIAFLPTLRKRLSSLDRAVLLPVLVFPFLYVALLSCRSDWQLWGWYLYAYRSAFAVSLVVLCAVPSIRALLTRPVVAVLLALFCLSRLPGLHWNIQGREAIYEAALDLQGFAASHPGTYAMGDRSGMPAYLMPDPVIQTEGLMMDRAFLESVRTQQPLLPVLARYGVRYFVGTSFEPFSGCFHAVEPIQAGPASPHMRADLCRPPVATFVHRGVTTVVYDLAPEAGQQP